MTATPQQPQHIISADDILAGLDPDQRAVATELDGPMRVLAGAGTGKTRAITHRIAYGIAIGRYQGPRVLALTSLPIILALPIGVFALLHRLLLPVRLTVHAATKAAEGDLGVREAELTELERMMLRLERNEPVQYVLGKAYFGSDIYEVTPDVLIPRPETEALCRWIVEETRDEKRLLDCCTGSGCIAITLQKRCPQLSVDAYDLSNAALDVARRNAERLQQDIHLFRMDALNPVLAKGKYDIIVANPPYICEQEKRDMRPNVLWFEPHEALFVPDNDPLRFYMAITRYAVDALNTGGRLYFEINPLFVEEFRERCIGFSFNQLA